MNTKILVPLDGSKTSAKTVRAVTSRKERFPVPLTLLHIVDLDRLAYRMIPEFQVEMVREQARKAGEHLLEEQQKLFTVAGMSTELRLEFGVPREVDLPHRQRRGFPAGHPRAPRAGGNSRCALRIGGQSRPAPCALSGSSVLIPLRRGSAAIN